MTLMQHGLCSVSYTHLDVYKRQVNRGWYKVVEEESPTGFSIQDDGVYEFYLEAGVSRELVVDNTPLSALVVYKYDSATKLPLEGARFELRYLSGEKMCIRDRSRRRIKWNR